MASIKKISVPVGTAASVEAIIKRRYYDKLKLKTRVPTIEVLEEVYGTKLPGASTTITTFLKELHEKTRSDVHAANSILAGAGEPLIELPSGSSFNNCNGRWTEYGYAAYAWNALVELNCANRTQANGSDFDVYIYIKLPNRNSDANDWMHLLKPAISTALSNFPDTHSGRITNSSDSNYGRRFELISSNPDSAIIKLSAAEADKIWKQNEIMGLDLYGKIKKLNQATTDCLDRIFEKMKGTVLPSENLQCFLSIKTSTRPDRRYQWVHEGDHIKTILQWIIGYSSISVLDPGLEYPHLNGKFFAISLSKVTDKDKEALNTGLAGSIITPSLKPIWAVDKLMECTSFKNVKPQIEEMLNF